MLGLEMPEMFQSIRQKDGIRTACSKLYGVVEMQYSDWKGWKDMAKDFIMNANKTGDGKQKNWLKLKWLRVEKSDYESFLVKEELDE